MHYQILLFLTILVCASSISPFASAQPVSASSQKVTAPYLQEAIEEIFAGQLPGFYQVQQGGAINYPDKTHGYYLILSGNASNTIMLIGDVRATGRRQGNLLRKGRFRDLAAHLLTHYMKTSPPTEINVDLERLELPSGDHGAAHLSVSDTKGFVRPLLITRLQYGQDRTVLLLVGLPGASVPKEHKRDFTNAYLTMEREARDIIAKIRLLDEPLLPSERYMLWRLRQIFYE